MKKLLLAVLIASFGLAACGVKGSLYFPEQQPAQQQTK
ncbi:lipoprotein [Actinobacillus pleuropneumoniae]